jgi:hypothetical protein
MTTRTNGAHVPQEDLLRRILGEFAEMPGLHLTAAEAARLWHLEEPACETLLSALVEQRSLTRTRRGAFVRAS